MGMFRNWRSEGDRWGWHAEGRQCAGHEAGEPTIEIIATTVAARHVVAGRVGHCHGHTRLHVRRCCRLNNRPGGEDQDEERQKEARKPTHDNHGNSFAPEPSRRRIVRGGVAAYGDSASIIIPQPGRRLCSTCSASEVPLLDTEDRRSSLPHSPKIATCAPDIRAANEELPNKLRDVIARNSPET